MTATSAIMIERASPRDAGEIAALYFASRAGALPYLRRCLNLFTFQRNTAARAFYERHGFRLVDLSDGTRKEEGEPDAHYAWRRSVSSEGL